MVFYLKINKYRSWSFRNISHWINSIHCDLNNKIYVICDNEAIKQEVKKHYDIDLVLEQEIIK